MAGLFAARGWGRMEPQSLRPLCLRFPWEAGRVSNFNPPWISRKSLFAAVPVRSIGIRQILRRLQFDCTGWRAWSPTPENSGMTANVNEWIWLKGLEIATFISGLLNLVIKMRSDSFFGSILRCPRKALSSLFSPARRTGDRMICLSWPRCSQAMKSGASRNTAICFVRHPNPM